MPTPMSFTDAYAEAVLDSSGKATHYDCLKLESSIESTVYRVVDSSTPLATPQGTYLPCSFEIDPPDTEGEIVGVMKITLKFLPRAARLWLTEQSRLGAVLSCTWLQYLGAGIEPDFECRKPLEITQVERRGQGVTFSATLPDLLAKTICRRLMLPSELPGMVA